MSQDYNSDDCGYVNDTISRYLSAPTRKSFRRTGRQWAIGNQARRQHSHRGSGHPRSEIPLVKKALDENKTIKFSFRVNDDKGPSMELAQGRSVSKQNPYAFQPDFVPHWANEVEFGFEK
jgi:hypothetical protein